MLSEAEIAAFQRLKIYLTTTTEEEPENGELMMPDFKEQFIICTDVCDEGLGAVLCQIDKAKKCRPVAFNSKKLSARERKYATGEKELIAVVFTMVHLFQGETNRHILQLLHF